jgi:hypothetical protein
MSFDYDVKGKRNLDSEMMSIISAYVKGNECFPKRIIVSKEKFSEFKEVFPSIYPIVFEYDNITIECDINQTEDYKLS